MRRKPLLIVAALGLIPLALWLSFGDSDNAAPSAPGAPAAALSAPDAALDLATAAVSDPAAADSGAAAARQALPSPASSEPAPEAPRFDGLCRLSGRLVDPYQRPLPGLAVQIYSHRGWPQALAAKPSPVSPESRGFETRTDDQGRFGFEFPPPPVGATLSAGDDPLRSRAVVQFIQRPLPLQASNPTTYLSSLLPGERDLGDLVLVPAAALEGRVLDASGQPLAGVSISSADQDRSSLGQYCRSAADGSLVLGGIIAPKVWAWTLADGYLAQLVGPFELRTGQIGGPLEIRLEPAPRVRGRLLNSRGEPLVGGLVDLFPATEQGAVVRTRSGPEGRFEVGLQSDSPYHLLADMPGYAPRQFANSLRVAPGAEVDVVLEPLPTTLFVVEDQRSGLPIETFHLEIRAGGSGWFGNSRLVPAAPRSFPTHPAGRLELAACEQDAVWVFAPGYGQVELPVSWENPDTRLCRIRLEPAARLLGRVLRAEAPAAGTALALTSVDGAQRRDARSDAAGRFEIADLPAGVYDLEVGDQSAKLVRSAIALAQGQILDLGFLELQPTGSLRVRLIPPPGQSASGLRLRLDDAKRGPAVFTDALGTARFTGLSSGPHRVFFPGVPQRFDPAPPLEALVNPGQERELSLELAPLEWCRLEVELDAPRRGAAAIELLILDLEPRRDSEGFLDSILVPPSPLEPASPWIAHLAPAAKGQLIAAVRSEPCWTWDGPKVEAAPGASLREAMALPASELWLRFDQDPDWPSQLRLELRLEVIETQAHLANSAEIEALRLQLSATTELVFDRRRPGALAPAAAELLAPGELRWSALPPGRFRAGLRLFSAADDSPLCSLDTELTLPANGSLDLTLR